MATDLYGLEASGLPPEMIARLQGLTRQQAIAEAMLKQSMQNPEAGAVKGRFQGVTSPLEHVGKLVQAAMAGSGMREAQRGNEALAKEASAGRSAAIEAMMAKYRGTPGVTPLTPVDDQGETMPATTGVAADPRGAIMEARMNPYLANAKFVDSMEGNLNRVESREDMQEFQKSQAREAQAARAADRAMQLEAKAKDTEAQLADRALNRESRERLEKMAIESKHEAAMARVEAQRLAAEARMDAKGEKASEKEQTRQRALKTVSDTLNEVSGYFDELEDLGAAVDSSKGALSNVMNYAAATAPGQALGRAVGTKAQEVREKINQASPMLLNAIRKATEQGARGLDSNVELKFYLQAVTDPSKLLKYNRAALNVLDRAYGLGLGIKGVSEEDEKAVKGAFKKSQAAAAPSAPPAGVDPAIWNAMTPEEKALWQTP